MAHKSAKSIYRGFASMVSKHSPEILTGIGIAGMVTTTILAINATPKAIQLIEIEKARINRELIKEAADNGHENCEQIHKLKPMEVIKVTWKCYIPTAATCAASIACLIGASSTNLKRNAALATAYKLSETALTEYRDKVVETIGEKKEHAIRDKVAEEKVKQNPVSSKEVIITGKGKTLCLDALLGRYFESDMDSLMKAVNEVNRKIVSYEYQSLNDFYDELNLPHGEIGDRLGWRLGNRPLELYFSSQLTDENVPCLVIDYSVAPKYGYADFA